MSAREGSLKRATALGPAARWARRERTIWCAICGRPLGQGEDFGRWRLRAVRPSPRYGWDLYTICPAHYPEGAGWPG